MCAVATASQLFNSTFYKFSNELYNVEVIKAPEADIPASLAKHVSFISGHKLLPREKDLIAGMVCLCVIVCVCVCVCVKSIELETRSKSIVVFIYLFVLIVFLLPALQFPESQTARPQDAAGHNPEQHQQRVQLVSVHRVQPEVIAGHCIVLEVRNMRFVFVVDIALLFCCGLLLLMLLFEAFSLSHFSSIFSLQAILQREGPRHFPATLQPSREAHHQGLNGNPKKKDGF